MSGKRSTKVTVTLSEREWLDVRRFLRRGADCAHGQCPPYTIGGDYYVRPLIAKINKALAEALRVEGDKNEQRGDEP